MTKERYEELKKQGGTIWHWKYGEIRIEDTDICEVRDLSGNHMGWNVIYFGENYDDVFLELKDLEDATKGKWKHKMTTERTERFEPPMWEEIRQGDEYIFRFITNNEYIYFEVIKDKDIDFNHIAIFNSTRNKHIFNKWDNDATKENYEKACEIVRDLFEKEAK